MTPQIAIILAIPCAIWALAWWDIQRRKTARDDRFDKFVKRQSELYDGLATNHDACRALDQRLSAVERNPATMSATKERMDTLEKAMANLVQQVQEQVEQLRARTMTITDRLQSRRFGGTRPNG